MYFYISIFLYFYISIFLHCQGGHQARNKINIVFGRSLGAGSVLERQHGAKGTNMEPKASKTKPKASQMEP